MSSYYLDRIPHRNPNVKTSVLLRESWREGRAIRKKTLFNLTHFSPTVQQNMLALMRGGVVFDSAKDAVSIQRALPHGHVVAALGMSQRLGLQRLLHRSPSRQRSLALAGIIARLLHPESKLGTARGLTPETATSSLGKLLHLGSVSGNEMLSMLDWLAGRQRWIEKSLAHRHLRGGTLLLYDVSSSYLEGSCCPLAQYGYNRDGKKGKKPIVFGLLCASNGCPVAVEVFAGNTADPTTLAPQVHKIRKRFQIERIALVGDRGLLTTARLREDLKPVGLDWISALTTKHLQRLVKPHKNRTASLFPEHLVPDQVAEISAPEDFPGERLLVCLNPRLREERQRKREELLRATEHLLDKIAAQVRSGSLRGKADIAYRIGCDINRRKVKKHFDFSITDEHFSWSRNEEKIAAEARLDGLYVVRTSLSLDDIFAQAAVESYKSLAAVERAFRTTKSHLRIRPMYVYTEAHVRGHVFLCMLAWYLEWHLRQELAPLLFEDDDRTAVQAQRTSPVEKAKVSERARKKAGSKQTEDGYPVHSFPTLLADLGTLTLNEVVLSKGIECEIVAEPTRLQRRVYELLGIEADKGRVPSTRTG